MNDKAMKRNALILVGSFEQGGSEHQAVQLAGLLRESNRYGVRLACLHDRGALRAEAERLGFNDIPSFPLTSFYDASVARQLRRFAHYLRANQIDIVQTFDFYTNVFGMTGAWLARTPARLAARRETGGMRSRAQAVIERRAFTLAHVVVANAEAVRRALIQDGVRAEKIVTVYNGTNTNRFRPESNLTRADALRLFDLPVEESRRFVTIVANMRHEVKDHRTFLRAARRVRERVPDAAFILAGEGELIPDLRSLAAELDLARDLFFVGRRAEISELLNLSEVCVLSSKSEGFSNAIIEYMAAGRAVVATDVGGAREQILEGETGYIVPPGDDEMMAARTVSLLEDKARAREMGTRGRKRIIDCFSCEAQLERTENLYGQLLENWERGRLVRLSAPARKRSLG